MVYPMGNLLAAGIAFAFFIPINLASTIAFQNHWVYVFGLWKNYYWYTVVSFSNPENYIIRDVWFIKSSNYKFLVCLLQAVISPFIKKALTHS